MPTKHFLGIYYCNSHCLNIIIHNNHIFLYHFQLAIHNLNAKREENLRYVFWHNANF